MRFISYLLIIIVSVFLGYKLSTWFSGSPNQTNLTENYSFIKDIAELASLEVTGTTTLSSSNVTNDGTWTDELKRLFLEKTVQLSAPYTAKYGVNLQDSSLRIERSDSVLKIILPPPRLLSYEVHMNRLQATNKKGWLQFENDEAYLSFEKKMYTDSRNQLANNEVFLTRSRDKICNIIQKYFAPLHVKTICIFDESLLRQSGRLR